MSEMLILSLIKRDKIIGIRMPDGNVFLCVDECNLSNTKIQLSQRHLAEKSDGIFGLFFHIILAVC